MQAVMYGAAEPSRLVTTLTRSSQAVDCSCLKSTAETFADAITSLAFTLTTWLLFAPRYHRLTAQYKLLAGVVTTKVDA